MSTVFIQNALLHLHGIGPKKLKTLNDRGIYSWDDIKEDTEIPLKGESLLKFRKDLSESRESAAKKDLNYLVYKIHPKEKWMVLAEYFRDAVFFDIETDGYFNRVTAVSALHRGTLRSFAKNENLESFADLLEEAELLVSFNGISFDLPVLARHFHLPRIPIPHIDLRWVLHQEGVRGGLKKIEEQFGIERPSDIRGLNGMDAVTLWYRWNEWKDTEALHTLKRYCSADVVSLAILFARLMEKKNVPFEKLNEKELWDLLP